MNETEIYQRAAELIEDDKNRFSCIAIAEAGGLSELENNYRQVFCPGDEYATDKQGFHYDKFLIQIERRKGDTQTARDLRVMLLCMMAACWQDFT